MSVLTETRSISFDEKLFPTLGYICNCSFCSQHVSESSLLRCLHSICNQCIKFISEYDGENQEKINSICPLCSVTTSISNRSQKHIPTNTIANEVTFWRAVRKKLEMCVDCFNPSHPPSTAIYYCLTCTLFMCKSDITAHNTFFQYNSHTVLSIYKFHHSLYSEHFSSRRFQVVFCKDHLSECIVSYNEVNNELLCQKCIYIGYQNEKQLPIEIILDSKLSKLDHIGVLANKKLTESERINLNLEEKLVSLKENQTNFLQQISTSFKILRVKLFERELFLNDLVLCSFSKQIRFLENIIRISNSKTISLKYCSNFCNIMYKLTSSPNFLLTENFITLRVQRLIAAIFEPPLSDFQNYSLSFPESGSCGYIEEYGNFQRLPGYTSRHFTSISMPHFQNASLITFDAHDNILIGNCEVIYILSRDVESNFKYDYATMKLNQVGLLKRIPLQSNLNKTSTRELNHIATCVKTQQLITVYSQDNSVDIFRLESCNETRSILLLGSIKFKNPQGLCTYSTCVYICDCLNNLVRVYNLADHKFLMENRFGNDIINSPMDISISIDELLHILEKKPFIHVFNLEGIHLKRIEIHNSCIQTSYKLIHCDKFNNILLANVRKNSVDLISTNGVEIWNTRSLISLSDNFSFIVNLADHLVICDNDKIYFL